MYNVKINLKKKKQVIAYLHTHWDREWYREYEVFRLRLVRVFDHVLDMLEENKIPSFYFDGQVVALLDYLELRPEKEEQIRRLIDLKKLFIGPFYCLVDEYLTDGICFRKNLEIGMKIAKNFGCTDFIGYLADTFGHSKNVPNILTEYGIDKAIVWRGCGDLPADFIYDGVNTVNLVRGYFMDIFSSDKSIEEKAQLLQDNLDKIAKKSGKKLLLPIGADHLDIPDDIATQIYKVNELLEGYEIKLGSPFEYFEKVKFKDYWSVLKGNRALQMLIVAASTDKIAMSVAGNATVTVMLFGILMGDYSLAGTIGTIVIIPNILITMFGTKFVQKLGQKKALVTFTWASIAAYIALAALFIFGDMTQISLKNISFTVM